MQAGMLYTTFKRHEGYIAITTPDTKYPFKSVATFVRKTISSLGWNVMQVPLTTIGVPVIEMGKKLGEKVVELIDNKEKLKEREEILYTPRLLVRGSTKSIPPVTVI